MTTYSDYVKITPASERKVTTYNKYVVVAFKHLKKILDEHKDIPYWEYTLYDSSLLRVLGVSEEENPRHSMTDYIFRQLEQILPWYDYYTDVEREIVYHNNIAFVAYRKSITIKRKKDSLLWSMRMQRI